MKTRLNFDTKVEHKDETYTVRNNKLFRGRTSVAVLSNAVLSNKIIRAFVDTIKSHEHVFTGKESFSQLVADVQYTIAAFNLLTEIKSWSTGKTKYGFYRSNSNTQEKFEMEMKELVRLVLFNDAAHWHDSKVFDTDNFKEPQNWTLDVLSNGFVGRKIYDWDFVEAYDAGKMSTKAMDKLLNQFETFDFAKYGLKKRENIAEVKAMYIDAMERVDNFKKLVDIAGNDLVNWSQQKVTRRMTKHSIGSIGHGWIGDRVEFLKSKGVKPETKPVIKKKTAIQKFHDGSQLSGNDLIRAFKAGTENQAVGIAKQMNADTASELLKMETKNVRSKLVDRFGRATSAFRVIFDLIASEYNESAYENLRSFCNDVESNSEKPRWERDDKISEYCTWEYLFTYSADIYLPYYDTAKLDFISDIPVEFFERHLERLKVTARFEVNTSITHAFIEKMTVADKVKFLHFCEASDKIKVDWSESSKLFADVPYKHVKGFLTSDMVRDWYIQEFTDLIVDANDTKLALEYLQKQNHCNPSDYEKRFFAILSYEQKVEALRERNGMYRDDIAEIVGADKERFLKDAIESTSLCHMIDAFENVDVNKLVANAESPCIPDHYASELTQANLAKVFQSHGWAGSDRNRYSYHGYRRYSRDRLDHVEPYKALERETYDMLFPDTTPNKSMYRNHLAGIMTGDEFNAACNDHPHYANAFIRANFDLVANDIVAVKCLARYHDKALFRGIVGDRRNRDNDAFGSKLESALERVKAVSETKLVLVK